MMKRQLFRSLVLMSLCGVLGGILTGCVWSVGGLTGVQATRGQELIDLKRARDQGAITQAEYDAKRKQILDR